MHFFTEYVQPLTAWIKAHPDWALIITFFISLSESFAIVGSLVPGSIMMTAVGVLAGSGVMRIDLAFLAAILGAIAGDGASYMLGYFFKDQIATMWPFNRHPHWLQYGKTYFENHGGKSVLIGRFIGPLRSLIPVIAGMMHMKHSHFFIANATSAVGWAILYVAPGILIGSASSQLSADGATRLISIFFLALIVFWLTSMGIHWLFRLIKHGLRIPIQALWIWSSHIPSLRRTFKWFIPYSEKDKYITLSLLAWLFLWVILTCISLYSAMQKGWITTFDFSTTFLLQSFRTLYFDYFFVVNDLFISVLPLTGLCFSIVSLCIYYRNWRAFYFTLSLLFINIILVGALNHFILVSNPPHLQQYFEATYFLNFNLTLATALFFLIIFYLRQYQQPSFIYIMLKILLIALLIMAGMGNIYLGKNWLSSVLNSYFLGYTFALAHWLLFRRKFNFKRIPLTASISLKLFYVSAIFIILANVSYWINFKKIKLTYLNPPIYIVAEDEWWNQNKPLLPLYITNRIGKPVGIFNIQYAGPIEKFKQALMNYGWELHPNSTLHTLLTRVNGATQTQTLSLFSQMRFIKKPQLTMTYNKPGRNETYILRLWQSNYHINEQNQVIWVGNLAYINHKQRTPQFPIRLASTNELSFYLLPALNHFKFTYIPLPKIPAQLKLNYPLSRQLLIIKY